MDETIISRTTYLVVFVLLALLLVATYYAAQPDWGHWNTVIAVGIAIAKALLIAVYFMHLRFSPALLRVFALAGVLWLSIAGALTLGDYLTRGQVKPPQPGGIEPKTLDTSS